MINEQKFYEALENIFVGAPIEGDGGYVNLLKIKEKYYSGVVAQLKNEISNDIIVSDSFKEDFYDLLYNFFEKYFSECGSVYFVKTANWQKVYEKVYTSNKDVVLFWKTNMLYYVKSDILFQSIYIKASDGNSDGKFVFYFDVGELQQKQNNEKKELIFSFKETQVGKVPNVHDDACGDKTFVLNVGYSERGRKTDIAGISVKCGVPEAAIEQAITIFKKQTTVDFFINKNAKAFLEEQLDLFLHQYLLDNDNEFVQNRLDQIKTVKKYALKLIAFISQFENELVKIWNKPKFVRKSNYVISCKTLKKLIAKDDYEEFKRRYLELLSNNPDCFNDLTEIIKETYKRPLQHLYVSNVVLNKGIVHLSYILFYSEDLDKLYKKQKSVTVSECQIVDKGDILSGYSIEYDNSLGYKQELSFDELFIDTRFLPTQTKDRLIELISTNNTLDSVIDGYIVKSDNYQFLRSGTKFYNRVDLAYIDPPFNTETEGFSYIDTFKDSTWISMMSDRFDCLYNSFLKENASLYVHGDHHCSHLMRILLDQICGTEKFNREIVWNTSPAISGLKAGPKVKNYIRQHDTVLFYEKGNPVFNKLYREYKNSPETVEGLGWLDLYAEDKAKPYIVQYDSNGEFEKRFFNGINIMALGDVWNDVYSMMYTQNMTRENWGKSNTQKPENLVRRFIQVSSKIGDRVVDIFVGSGTTIAAAHKLGRKWIGVDSGSFIDDIVIKRMKSVVMGDFMPKLSEDLNWQGGGFFKYYSLEQYEDALDRCVYSTEKGELYDKDVFGQYVFFADEKLSGVLNTDGDNIELDFTKLYDDIDFPETISMLLGKPIEKITADEVKLEGITAPIKYNIAKMNNEEKIAFIKLVKPLIWWGE